MKHDHYCFHVSKSSEDQKKGLYGKFEEFLSPKLSEDQKKKTFSPKIEEFLSPKASEDQTKVQRSSSAQMQTIVKLSGGCSQMIGGDISPPGFGTPVQYDMNVIISKTDSRQINGASKLGAELLDYAMSPRSFPSFLTN